MISNTIKELNKNGFIEIENFVSDKTFNQFKKDTNDYLSNSINKNFYLTDNDLDNTIFNQYYNDQEVIRLVDEIFKEKKFNYKIDECYRVFRALVGKGSDLQNKKLHFDSYYLTLMFPIRIPKYKDGENGDFYILPNIRKTFKNKYLNLLIKFIFQNKVSFLFYKSKIFDKIFKPIKIIPKEKSIIIFWGYKSLHGSGILGKNRERVTLLYHFKKMK